MTSHSPNSANPYLPQPARRTKLRWEYWFMGGIVLVLGGMVVAMLALGLTSNTTGSTAPTSTKLVTGGTSTDRAVDPAAAASSAQASAGADSGITLEDAQMLVDDSASLKRDGRWDEARDRLDSITSSVQRDALGVDALTAQLTADHDRWTQLDTQLADRVAARDWPAANTTIAQLAAIAALDDAHLATRETIRLQLAPKSPIAPTPQPAAAAAKPAAATPHSSTAKPTIAKPAASTNVPKPGGTAAAAGDLIQQGIDSMPDV